MSLNTALRTQALAPMQEEPLVLSQDDVLRLEGSVRSIFTREMMLRRASGRERKMAFSHELTPDILVWCSRSYPRGNGNRPRLEAYVCSPLFEEKGPKSFSSRGAIISTTKKHTTQVPDAEVITWLEKDYPFSYIQGRYTANERKKLGVTHSLKPAIHVRDEIIEHYTPVLQGKNIALKTLWYLYPNLRDRYSESEYNIFSEMMYTAIGQQRVADLTSELCEQLLMDTYPNLSQTTMWKFYGILASAMDAAVSLEYCSRNPLKEALQRAQTRDKLFAQVRRVLVKKHFSEQEMTELYQFIQTRIREGETAYLGVLIRILTGLESNVVCAIRWCDLKHIPEYDISVVVITRQMTLDGEKIIGFSDAEDYMCFPLPRGLCAELEKYQNAIKNYSHKELILSAIASSGKEQFTVITPGELNRLTKKTIAELHIDERVIVLPDNNDGTRSTNLNKYSGDLIRENFRYWAIKAAKLNADESSYLLRNKCPSTLGRFYCDFLSDASQLIMSAKLSRWESMIGSCGGYSAYRYSPVYTDVYLKKIQPSDQSRQEVLYEITGSGKIEAVFESDFGVEAEIIKIDR